MNVCGAYKNGINCSLDAIKSLDIVSRETIRKYTRWLAITSELFHVKQY